MDKTMANNEQENLNSENEEQQEENTEEQAEEQTESTEEQSDDSSEETSDDSSSQDEGEESDDDLSEQLRVAREQAQRYKAERDRLKKGNKGDRGSDDATLARLENRGVMESEDQEYVLKVAKNEGVSAVEALSLDFVKDRLEANKRTRDQRAATPNPSRRTGTAKKDVDYYVRRYQEKGELPSDSKLVAQVVDKLAER